MPYIITTTPAQIGPDGAFIGGLPFPDRTMRTRTAVATLDEARASILADLGDCGAITGPEDDLCGEVYDLSESGGTVGPLPDGTVIEVRSCSWTTLDNLIWGSTRRLREPEVIGEAERATLSYFNARESYS